MRLRRCVLITLAVVLSCLATAYADQPNMKDARAHLVAARTSLQNAEHNKGGHRARAIGLINQAVSEVDKGIAYDRRHNHAEGNSSLTPDQPHMKAALDQLNDAKQSLDAATNDKGGHRVKALGYVNSANTEVAAGIAAGN